MLLTLLDRDSTPDQSITRPIDQLTTLVNWLSIYSLFVGNLLLLSFVCKPNRPQMTQWLNDNLIQIFRQRIYDNDCWLNNCSVHCKIVSSISQLVNFIFPKYELTQKLSMCFSNQSVPHCHNYLTSNTTTTTTTAVAGPGPGPPQAYPGQLPPLGHCDQPSTKSEFPLKGRVLKSCHSAWEPDNLTAEKCQSR